MFGLVNASPSFLKIEIVWAVEYSAFQRTYVMRNAVGLFLNYWLKSPSMPEWHGLRFSKSPCVTAKRMGLDEEGVMGWTWVLLDDMEENGRPIRNGDPESLKAGRDNVMLSLCEDDWENGGREHKQPLIGRVFRALVG
ncbi:hypothetical protein BJV74DRAFT_771204 [Russula compacta]|nr:hypothetical protein BJV74DRAFT_771204 [Russula compacta]